LAGRSPRRQAAGYAVAVLGTIGLTASLIPFRSDITPLSAGFGYLVVVVVAAAIGGLGPGGAASVFGFLTFNFYFLNGLLGLAPMNMPTMRTTITGEDLSTTGS